MNYNYITILLFLFLSFQLSAQNVVIEYNYYPAYGNLEKQAYRLLNRYTQKELDRRPYGREVEEVSYFINEAFAVLGVNAFAQQGNRKAVRQRVRAIELMVKRHGANLSMELLQDCFLEVCSTQLKRKSKSTKQKFNYQYKKRYEAYATK